MMRKVKGYDEERRGRIAVFSQNKKVQKSERGMYVQN